MQVSDKYGLIYVVTKAGLLFVYDLETATAIYRNRVSQESVFLTAASESTGGVVTINRFVAFNALRRADGPHCRTSTIDRYA